MPPPPKMTPEERKALTDAFCDGLTMGAEDPVGLAQDKEAKRHGASLATIKLFGSMATDAPKIDDATDGGADDADTEA